MNTNWLGIGDRIVLRDPLTDHGTYNATITGIHYYPEGAVEYYVAGKVWVRPHEILGKTKREAA